MTVKELYEEAVLAGREDSDIMILDEDRDLVPVTDIEWQPKLWASDEVLLT